MTLTVSCRLCGKAVESICHWGECPCLRKAFELLRSFDNGERWNDRSLNLLGTYRDRGIVDHGVSLIHFIVWKFILIALTSLSVNGTPFDVNQILESAKARVYKRIATARYMARKIALRAATRGLTPSYAAWPRPEFFSTSIVF